jgi:hypothetical protein
MVIHTNAVDVQGLTCVAGERVAVTTAVPGAKIPNAEPCDADSISPDVVAQVEIESNV